MATAALRFPAKSNHHPVGVTGPRTQAVREMTRKLTGTIHGTHGHDGPESRSRQIERIFRANCVWMLHLATGILHDSDDGADCVQRVFLKLLRSSVCLDNLPSAYFARAIRNEAFDMRAERLRVTAMCEPPAPGGPSPSVLEQIVNGDEARRLVLRLPKRCRAVAEARARGLTYKEIAASLHISVKTVSAQLEKAKSIIHDEEEREREREKE